MKLHYNFFLSLFYFTSKRPLDSVRFTKNLITTYWQRYEFCLRSLHTSTGIIIAIENTARHLQNTLSSLMTRMTLFCCSTICSNSSVLPDAAACKFPVCYNFSSVFGRRKWDTTPHVHIRHIACNLFNYCRIPVWIVVSTTRQLNYDYIINIEKIYWCSTWYDGHARLWQHSAASRGNPVIKKIPKLLIFSSLSSHKFFARFN